MRLSGPVLTSIKSYLSADAKKYLEKSLQKPNRSEISFVGGAQCHSSALKDGTKVCLICRMGSKDHIGIDVDLKHGGTGGDNAPDIQIRETWNGKASIEMRINQKLIECRANDIQGKEIGDCISLPPILSRIASLSVKSIEEHPDEMVIHLEI